MFFFALFALFASFAANICFYLYGRYWPYSEVKLQIKSELMRIMYRS